MRVSVRENDPGYKSIDITRNCNIFVDGENVTNRCFTADEELEEACVYKLNEKGEKYYDPVTNSIPWEVLKGNVEIVLDN